MLLLQELKENILAQGYDECLICDILEISVSDLLKRFEDKLELKRDDFIDEEDEIDLDFN